MRTGRPAKTMPSVLAALQADAAPSIGMTHGALMASAGIDAVQASAAVALLIKAGKVVRLGEFKDSRFVVADRAPECGMAYAAYMAAVNEDRRVRAVERNRDASRRYYAKLRADAPPKPPKQKPPGRPKGVVETKPRAKPAKPKHKQKPMTINPAMNAPVHITKPPKAKWADLPAIVPPGVRVQKLPGCPTQARFEPPRHFKGEFLREFEQLCRSGG